ncbi:MAG: hypothetical protein JJU10_04700 [Idiomarina sp.]|nr:hypothetical protein [Idiomarina sp.]
MRRIALAAALLCAGLSVQASDRYDPIFTPAPDSPRAQQGVLIGLDQSASLRVTSGAFGLILTQRGGSDWVQAEVPTSVLLTSVSIVDDEHIWVAGHEGVLLQSTDGGVTWERRMDGFQLLELEFPWLEQRQEALEAKLDDAEDEFEAEEIEIALEELTFLTQGAEIQFDVGPTKPFLDIHFVNRELGFALAAYGTLLRTQDGGDSWEILTGKLDNPTGNHLNKITTDSNGAIVIVGEFGLLARSDDQGDSWEMLDSPYHGSLFGALFDNEDRLWIYGLRGNVFVSDNGGYDFAPVAVETRYNLNSGVVLRDGRVALVGHSGVIAVIDPDTMETTLYSHASNTPLTGIRQSEGNQLILVGRAGLQEFYIPVAAGGTEG